MIAAVTWLLAVQALALAALPLTQRTLRALPAGGYGLSKAIGVALVAYVAWLLSMVGATTFTRATLLVIGAAIAIGCWWLWGKPTIQTLRRHWRVVAALEVVFLLTFVAATLVRAQIPDVVGQEKFMDLAILNAFLVAPDLPAEDPWLAGHAVPYYHLGYLMLAVPGRISGGAGPVVYNLAVAHVFAATSVGAATVVYGALANRAGSRDGRGSAFALGLFGAAIVALCGNLVGPLELVAAAGLGDAAFWQAVGVKNLAPAATGGWLPSDPSWWWRASRVIPNIGPDGINEFPFFSFLLGDLHPHYTALPLDLAIVGLALAAWRDDGVWVELPFVTTAAVLLGLLIGASTWDVPTFWGLVFLAGVATVWKEPPTRRVLSARLARRLVPFVAAMVAVAPYFVGYTSQQLGLGVVTERTPLVSLLLIFGPLIVGAAVLGVWTAWPTFDRRPGAPRPGRPTLAALTLGAFAVLLLAAVGQGTLATLTAIAGLLAIGGWALAPWRRRPGDDPAVFAWLLSALAVAVLIAVELVYVSDLFGTRMNTVFKFHYHAWVLLALAAAITAGLLWDRSAGGRRAGSRLVAIGLAGLILAPGLVYPLAATWTRTAGWSNEPTLDGARFLRRASAGDYDAIGWLRANAGGRPVVVEAVGPDYGEHARVSAFSGLPTVIGWIGHELQWRGSSPELERRRADVDQIYQATARDDLVDRANRYRARFLFFGSLERERYGQEAGERLGRLLQAVYASGGTTVYAVPPAGGGAGG